MSAEAGGWRVGLAQLATVVAVVLPTLVLHWVIVGYAVFAQLVAGFCWGLAIAAWAVADPRTAPPWRSLAPLLATYALLAIAIALTAWRIDDAVPGPIVCAVGLVVVSSLATVNAARLAAGPCREAAIGALVVALLVAGGLGTALGLVQIFVPQWADGFWIAPGPIPGRITGNLLQPNMLATFIAWAMVAVVIAQQRAGWGAASTVGALALLSVAAGLTASRTGLLELAALAAWGLIDRTIPTRTRWALMASPLLALATIYAVTQGMAAGGAPQSAADLSRSSARTGVYTGALALIAAHPWVGLGWNEFGLAWALSPQTLPDRLRFDHSHNIVLQWALELGLPVTGALVVGLAVAFRAAWQRSHDVPSRGLLMLLVVVGIHSLLEMPLWFAYTLLPAAWVFGLVLARDSRDGHLRASGGATARSIPWLPVGVAVSAGSFVVFADFVQVLDTTLPGTPDTVLQERVALARRSVLFHQIADHEAATRLPSPPLALFAGASYAVIDAPLMAAWSRALAREGRLDEARLVAQRLRLHLAASGSRRVIPCDDQVGAEVGLPCGNPGRPVDWRSLR